MQPLQKKVSTSSTSSSTLTTSSSFEKRGIYIGCDSQVDFIRIRFKENTVTVVDHAKYNFCFKPGTFMRSIDLDILEPGSKLKLFTLDSAEVLPFNILATVLLFKRPVFGPALLTSDCRDMTLKDLESVLAKAKANVVVQRKTKKEAKEAKKEQKEKREKGEKDNDEEAKVHCQGCHKLLQKGQRKRCAGCLTVWYCSKQCQIRGWKAGHAKVCESAPSLSSLRKTISMMEQVLLYSRDSPEIWRKISSCVQIGTDAVLLRLNKDAFKMQMDQGAVGAFLCHAISQVERGTPFSIRNHHDAKICECTIADWKQVDRLLLPGSKKNFRQEMKIQSMKKARGQLGDIVFVLETTLKDQCSTVCIAAELGVGKDFSAKEITLKK